MNSNVSGNDNSAFGYNAAYTNKTGRRITVLGSGADVSDDGFKNSTAIGYGATTDASYKVRIGNAFVKSIGGAVDWTVYADARTKQNVNSNVPGLAFIKELKPVTYQSNTAKENELLGKMDALNEAKESNIDKIQFTGLIAQDVDAAAKKINYDFSGVDKTGKIWGLRYSEFVVPVIKALQELNDSLISLTQKQQGEIDALQSKLNDIEARLNDLQPSDAAAIQSSSDAVVTGAGHLSVYPNPAKNNLTVTFDAKAKSSAAVIITDINGKTVIQKSVTALAGKNTINVGINPLAQGTYILQVKIAGINASNRFVKE